MSGLSYLFSEAESFIEFQAGEIKRLKALVESAYREGWHDGHWSELAEVDDLWPDSATRKALRGENSNVR
jgi:hypothetical protein